MCCVMKQVNALVCIYIYQYSGLAVSLDKLSRPLCIWEEPPVAFIDVELQKYWISTPGGGFHICICTLYILYMYMCRSRFHREINEPIRKIFVMWIYVYVYIYIHISCCKINFSFTIYKYILYYICVYAHTHIHTYIQMN